MAARRLTSMAAATGAAVLATLIGTGATAPLASQPGFGAQAKGAKASCPAKPQPVISSAIPADVCIPDGFPGIATDYFDDYSWRAFVALLWPAAPGRRGVPAAAKTLGAPGPRVFETYKPLWEIFHADGS